MATCYFCETDIPDGLAICPHCGKQQPTPTEQRRTMVRLLVCVGLFILTALAASLINGARPHL